MPKFLTATMVAVGLWISPAAASEVVYQQSFDLGCKYTITVTGFSDRSYTISDVFGGNNLTRTDLRARLKYACAWYHRAR